MDTTIFSILFVDGMTNGAIYALIALALVMLFAITRVIYIPQGEYVAFSALTMGVFQLGQVPGTVWFLLAMAGLVAVLEGIAAIRAGQGIGGASWRFLRPLLFPACVCALAVWVAPLQPPLWVHAALTLALVTPFGPLVYRLAYQGVAGASVLVLLIVSVGVHFALTGLGLAFFGAEGFRIPSFWDASIKVGAVNLSGQAIVIMGAAVAIIVLLWLYFERTLQGKALQATAVNRLGARLMGISVESAGRVSFTVAAFIGALSGLLIGPTTTVFYDSGFLIGLKGFVAAVFGGLASYPAALFGALIVGTIEAFSSFWASAFKEVIVFTSILPILLWRSLRSSHAVEE